MKNVIVFVLLALVVGLGARLMLLEQTPQASEESDDSEADDDVAVSPRRSIATAAVEALGTDGANAARAEAVGFNNRGVELLESGALDAAIESFEQAYAALPDDDVFRGNLSESLVRRAIEEHDAGDGDRDAALQDLERAVELDPERQELADLLDRWKREDELESEFASYTSMHFEVGFDGERTDILLGVQRTVDVLEDAYADYWAFFGNDPVDERGSRLRVTLYEPEQFHDLTGLGHWAGGAFDGTLRIPIADFERDESRWSRTLRHELLHAFLEGSGGADVPGWLNEGLAQHFEQDVSTADLDAARRQLEGSELFTLEQLSKPLSSMGGSDRVGRAYAQSLLFTDYLLRQYGEMTVARMVTEATAELDASAVFESEIGIGLGLAHQDFLDSL